MTFQAHLVLLLMVAVGGLMCGQYARLPRFRRQGQEAEPVIFDPEKTFVCVVHLPWYEEDEF
jgi:hypothetical protein